MTSFDPTWDLAPQGSAVHVITDEAQHGIMPTLLGPLLEPRMLGIHDLWLARLDARATNGATP